jgi:uncharacterized protein YidB (DUF937 family)
MKSKKWIAILSATALVGTGAAVSLPAFAATQTSVTITEKPSTDKSNTDKLKLQQQGLDRRIKEISSILGVDVTTLKKDLKAGQSIADVAKSKGISEQTLVTDLTNQLKAKLDKEVSNGKLTADKEKQMLANANTRFTKLIENTKLFNQKRYELFKDLTSILGIDAKTLKSDLQSGQSIVDIAQSKGISEQTLLSDLNNKLKERLDQVVKNGKITTDKENQILSKATNRFTQLVEKKGWEHSEQSSDQTNTQTSEQNS